MKKDDTHPRWNAEGLQQRDEMAVGFAKELLYFLLDQPEQIIHVAEVSYALAEALMVVRNKLVTRGR